MSTTSHAKHTWMLYAPKANRETVALRYGLTTLNSYTAGDRPHVVLTFPQLKVLSILYQSFIEAMDQSMSGLEHRTVNQVELGTTKLLLKRLMSLNLISNVERADYSITDYGADEYEFQWYVADNVRKIGPDKSPSKSENKKVYPSYRFTEVQVRNIRSADGATIQELAELYKCSPGTIWRIRNYQTYKEVT